MSQIKKILIAEDSPAIVEALTMMLEDEAYVVVTASGVETLERVSAELPDVIFLDIWMPGMNGSEICEQLKKQERTKHIPIIMLSANKDTAMIAKEVGADDFLLKPFEIEAVLALVERHMAPRA